MTSVPGHFQATDRLDLDHMEEYMEVRPMLNTRDVAMRVHSGFRWVCLGDDLKCSTSSCQQVS